MGEKDLWAEGGGWSKRKNAAILKGLKLIAKATNRDRETQLRLFKGWAAPTNYLKKVRLFRPGFQGL